MLIMRTGLSVHLWLWPVLVLEIGALFLGAGLTSAHGADIKDNRAIEILSNFRQTDEQIGKLFRDAALVADMGGRASMFVRKDGTRYAFVAFPVRGSLRPERIGEPYCRSRLLTPERKLYEAELLRKVTDRLVSKHLFRLWRSAGRIDSAKVTTRKVPDAGHAVSLCRVQDGDVTGTPTTLTAADIRAARIAVADAAFADGKFRAAARRYRDLFGDTKDATLLMKEVISLLESGDLDAGFARDEMLQSYLEAINDPDLLERYENAMSKAITAYMSVTE